MSRELLRIFVSSPGDVAEERIISQRVLSRLADRFRDVIQIEAILWEHEPLLASQTFQTQIVSPAEVDIVVCILWSRLGTRLPSNIARADGSAYASGTEYEFETALEAARIKGTPQLLIYRKTIKPYVSLDDSRAARAALEQKEALDAFLNKWFHDTNGALKAAFHPFDESSAFERDLEEHLQKLIEQRVGQLGHAVLSPEVPLKSEARRKIRNPFRGLDIFNVEHSAIFFGRTRAVSEVLNALRQQHANGRAFVLVLGMSGCGKSSLVRAGVLPLLTQPGIIEGASLWRHAILRPSDATGDVFHGLVAALVRPDALPELTADGTAQQEIARLLRDDPRSAAVLTKGALSQAAGAAQMAEGKEVQPRAKLALVIDQFEELFTLESVTAKQRERFVEVLSSLACGGRVCVIATLRSDFYARCAELPRLVWLKEGPGQYDLLPPMRGEFAQIIRRPAQYAGLQFERHPETGEGLDEHLLDAASQELASLPLLEFTLEELYKQRSEENTLTYEAYRRLGGVAGSLGRRAEEVFAGLERRVRASLPAVFRQLATIRGNEDMVPARRRVPLEQLREHGETAAIVDAFVEARLFTTDRTDDGIPVVRVTHESLFTHWRALQEWLERDREFLRIRSRISTATDRWLDEHRRTDLLLQAGKPLQEGMQLIDAGFELSTDEDTFIKESLRQARRQTFIKRSAAAAMLLLTICAVAGGLVANNQRLRADRANLKLRETVEEKTQLAEENKKLAEAEREARVKIENDLKANRRFLSRLVGGATSENNFSDPQFLRELANTKTPLALLLFASGMIETDPDQAAVALRQVIAYDPELSLAHASLGQALAKKGEIEAAVSSFHQASRLEPNNPMYQNNLGYSVYLEHGQYDKAAEEFRKAIEIDSHYALAHANLGAALAKLGSIEEAKAAFRKAIELQPNNVVFQNNLGYSVYLEHGRYNKAAEEFRRAIEIDPDYAVAHANLGQSLAKLGSIEEAAAAYHRAIELQPNNVVFQNNLGYYVYFEHAQYENASKEIRKAIEIDPNYALAHANLGLSLAKLGSIEEAAAAYRRAIELQPNNVYFQNNLGYNVYFEHAQYDVAAESFRKAIEIDPNYAWAHANLGAALAKLGSIEEAKAAFRKAIELEPSNVVFQNNLGYYVYLEHAQYDEAAESFRKAIEIDPNYAWPHANMGAALAKLGSIEEAKVAFRKAIELEPSNVVFQNNLGYYAYLEHGRYDNAAEEFRRAIEIDPDFALAHANLGQSLAKLGKTKEAAAAYSRAIELQPNNVVFQNNLGHFVYFKHAQYENAAKEFRKAIEIDPDYAIAHANLGAALAKLGLIEEAAAAYYRAIELEPNNALFLNKLGYYVYFEHGRYEKAVKEFQKAIEIDPKFGTAYSNLGSSLLQLERIKQSIEAFRQSTELEPGNAQFQMRLGDALKAGGDLNQAVDAYRKATQIAPAYAQYHEELGLALLALERNSEAVAAFRRAAQLAPKDAGIQANYVEALLISGDANLALRQLSSIDAVMRQRDFSLLGIYYRSLALNLLNKDATNSENALLEQLARVEPATHSFDFSNIDTWIERAKIAENVKDRLRKLTKAMKAHFQLAHQSAPAKSVEP